MRWNAGGSSKDGKAMITHSAAEWQAYLEAADRKRQTLTLIERQRGPILTDEACTRIRIGMIVWRGRYWARQRQLVTA